MEAFQKLKKALVTEPVIVAPYWRRPFELMSDASDYVVGAVQGQRYDKIFHSIYYASKTLIEAPMNYTITEKELLAVVFAFDKFRSYLVGTKVIVYIDHSDHSKSLTAGLTCPPEMLARTETATKSAIAWALEAEMRPAGEAAPLLVSLLYAIPEPEPVKTKMSVEMNSARPALKVSG